jgi:WhiB family redox-sensing transcriptional regulator
MTDAAEAPHGKLDWEDDALCAETGPSLFFPTFVVNDRTFGMYAEARTICEQCEVRRQCLNYALDNDERTGFWGGMSPIERKKILIRQGRWTGKP